VVGPNQRRLESDPKQLDADDLSYPLRRALFIRGRLGVTGELDWDPGLLNALLETPQYLHGGRSLEKLISSLRPNTSGAIRRSTLPPPRQLAMHVEEKEFMKLLERDVAFQSEPNLTILAKAIHEAWREISHKEGWSMQYDVDFEKLPSEIQEDNRAAAARIPEVLALAGLCLKKGLATPEQEEAVRAHLEHDLELLAGAEHVGWMSQRLKNGWQFAPERDDGRKLHPALVPYPQLSKRTATRTEMRSVTIPAWPARRAFESRS
jgi:hypothetical protein